MAKPKLLPENKKKIFLDLFPKMGFNASRACKHIGIGKSVFTRWLQNDADFREQYEEQKWIEIQETAEMHRLIRKGIPLLKEDDKGNMKHVGWVEKPDREAIHWHLERFGGKEYQKPNNQPITTPVIKIIVDNPEQAEELNKLDNLDQYD